MNRQEYDDHYRDAHATADRVAAYVRVPVNVALSAVNRRSTKNVAVFNHYSKLLGFLSFHETWSMLQDFGKLLSVDALETALWSAEGVEIADGFIARDGGYRSDTRPTIYEPLEANDLMARSDEQQAAAVAG